MSWRDLWPFELTKRGREAAGMAMVALGGAIVVVSVALCVSWLIKHHPGIGVPLMTGGAFLLIWQGLRWMTEDE